MLKVQTMVRIRITGSKHLLENVIDALYKLHLVHIRDYTKPEFFSIGKPLEKATIYSKELIRLRSFINLLGLEKGGDLEEIRNVGNAKKRFEDLEKRFFPLNKEKEQLENRLSELSSLEKDILPLKELGLKSDEYRGYESLAVFHGYVSKLFEEKLREITKTYELYKAKYNNRIIIALFVPREKAEKVREFLNKYQYEEIVIPIIDVDLNRIEDEKKKISKRLADVQKAMHKIRKQRAFILGYEDYLSKENEKAESPLRFALSETAFLIEGWVPLNKKGALQEELNKITNKKIHLEFFSDREAPVALENPRIVQPFEFFMNLYALPRYLELDPTSIVFLTFPLFFGFMLGDIGYGLITLLLFFILAKKTRGELKALSNALIVASIATIIFGFVFGEFFGVEIFEKPILNRAHDINTMLLVSVLVGFIHVNLGFIIGFFSIWREYSLKHAIYAKFSWMIIEGGIILMGLQYLNYINIPLIYYPAGLLVLVGLIMLYKGEGAKGIIELPALMSNILSYARLFAMGLSSVLLAAVINKQTTLLFYHGGVFILLGIIVLVFGHGLNLLLGILGPFLQSLRLHYVEFFTKFFEGGGKPYSPFGR